ncbi:helix-turn-helix domain-containing protein [Formosa sp. 3Alg 14/1]|uniref:DNA-binding protein n=1 Tax=Formosa agariphila (strain DSM 15362 / KCTC 12365 / LMG 23005 / KMM 3901 / M-2Alg 35-1) TaxID=1347342 RepID=T2KPA4_FORAG|nr:helix-turn-helix domain-containing protein [Formosa agariphila]CDF80291.1 DNA-binding protein [Formosa agariphila KMM 3901]
MATKIITSEDLSTFKTELLQDIKNLLTDHAKIGFKKHYRTSEVLKLLQISSTTLKTLKVNGTLPYSKIGGTCFYKAEDIQHMLEDNRVD